MLKNIIVALICLFSLVVAAPTERSLISHIGMDVTFPFTFIHLNPNPSFTITNLNYFFTYLLKSNLNIPLLNLLINVPIKPLFPALEPTWTPLNPTNT
ncbi:hypothetical protein BKA69DRAFT_1096947 [Paraphysoderma sedebokerense]|nr:hypothetical protein BKA69DRAFT_1096947 [Paraphysoderma sedebokerense]